MIWFQLDYDLKLLIINYLKKKSSTEYLMFRIENVITYHGNGR